MAADPAQLGFESFAVPGYEINSFVGQGASSSVFTATKNGTEELVALKLGTAVSSNGHESEMLNLLAVATNLAEERWIPTRIELATISPGRDVLIMSPVAQMVWSVSLSGPAQRRRPV